MWTGSALLSFGSFIKDGGKFEQLTESVAVISLAEEEEKRFFFVADYQVALDGWPVEVKVLYCGGGDFSIIDL